MSKGEESQGLTCFLRALKIDKSDRALQMRTLALYQKLSKWDVVKG